MSYQFKLEALRRYRIFQEEAQQKMLSEIQRRLDEACSVLECYRENRRRTEIEMHQRQQCNPTGSQVTIYIRYLQRLVHAIDHQKSQVADLQRKVDQARNALLEAVKKRKSLDKLKENGMKEYLAELDADELKFINEIAINRYILKQH